LLHDVGELVADQLLVHRVAVCRDVNVVATCHCLGTHRLGRSIVVVDLDVREVRVEGRAQLVEEITPESGSSRTCALGSRSVPHRSVFEMLTRGRGLVPFPTVSMIDG
jgi:hypothetical protein